MTSATDLYQEVILNHSRQPRHFGPLEGATHKIEAENPLCGDHYEVFLKVDENGIIRDVSFEGAGCAISKASASIMTENIIGKSLPEFQILFKQFHSLVKGDADAPDARQMGKLAAFSGIWKFPARVKCAILCWHAVNSITQDQRHEP